MKLPRVFARLFRPTMPGTIADRPKRWQLGAWSDEKGDEAGIVTPWFFLAAYFNAMCWHRATRDWSLFVGLLPRWKGHERGTPLSFRWSREWVFATKDESAWW